MKTLDFKVDVFVTDIDTDAHTGYGIFSKYIQNSPFTPKCDCFCKRNALFEYHPAFTKLHLCKFLSGHHKY